MDTVQGGTEQVRDGQLDVLVYGARAALRVTVDTQLDPRLRATLDGQVRQQILDAQIAQLGARPDDMLSKVDQAQISVTQLHASDPNLGQRRVAGVVTSLLLTWALVTFSVLAARRVAEDAERGTGEALLTVLRPRRLLAGNLGGIGLAGLAHLALVGVLATILSMTVRHRHRALRGTDRAGRRAGVVRARVRPVRRAGHRGDRDGRPAAGAAADTAGTRWLDRCPVRAQCRAAGQRAGSGRDRRAVRAAAVRAGAVARPDGGRRGARVAGAAGRRAGTGRDRGAWRGSRAASTRGRC